MRIEEPKQITKGQNLSDERIRQAIAPTGRLRCTINYGNPILARLESSGSVGGVSVDIARILAARLEVELELLAWESAGKAVTAVEEGRADVGFFARDPDRGKFIAFTEPYILIEGCYLVRDDSAVTTLQDVDATGIRLTVGKGSAYDLYLTREIKNATIERAPTSPAVVQTFLDSGADVAAGVRQQLEHDAKALGGLRMLPGHFMVIEQAMGIARTHGADAHNYLSSFVEQVKSEGIVGQALARNGIADVSVAPPKP
ncbi:transporter substrate-binding domain-containing protein [Agrobacterium tumefaciens]|uniref:Transporter substrate-binding domain-containing protein n=1 Tax=Agrobacterium tumefaciens TaxID=358 RepID=A0AA44F6D8_AGRTU|nr:transporter substrate-binding domain-containing protein [Agrobacterium tumefaciens]NTB87548.1 transporter substrate-binding domain-containing protein [Agrobacterium tumefaciens]NTC19757.1 transporter substrate-binding domain-containing protein [Agrobacterium tumefaciens]NTC29685.1 transporter substrate-binding domain-containing protein [Agrobacterium tumefaciens]